MHVHLHVCTYVCTHVCMYVYVCICVRTVRTNAPPNSTRPYCATTVKRRMPTKIGFFTSPWNTFMSLSMLLMSEG